MTVSAKISSIQSIGGRQEEGLDNSKHSLHEPRSSASTPSNTHSAAAMSASFSCEILNSLFTSAVAKSAVRHFYNPTLEAALDRKMPASRM